MHGILRVGYRSKQRSENSIWGPVPFGSLLVRVPPGQVKVNEGTQTSGTPASTKECDNTELVVQETADGINVEFAFTTDSGGNKKIKIKGSQDGGDTYSIQAYDGTSWVTLQDVTFDTETSTYTVNIPAEYIINDELRVRVFKDSGNNEKLYMDCVYLLSESPGSGLVAPSDLSLLETV